MTTQLLTACKWLMKTIDECLFSLCKLLWILWVDSWEVTWTHLIFLTIEGNCTLLIVDSFEQTTIVHLPKRMTANHLWFNLKLKDTDSLVHLRCQCLATFVEWIVFRYLWHELLAWVITIYVHCKGSQLNKVDTISILNSSHVCITQGYANDITDTSVVTSTGSHP